MKSSWKQLLGSLSHSLREMLQASTPQLYLDRWWEASRTYFFSTIFISLVLSKVFHIGVHFTSLTVPSFLVWGSTFFLADVLLILVARGLTRSFEWRSGRYLAALVTILFSLYVSSMLSANVSHYVHTGVEIHWRKSNNFLRKKPSTRSVLSAWGVGILVDMLIMASAYVATPYLYQATGGFLRIWSSSLSATFACCCCRREKQAPPDPETYEQIPINDYDSEGHSDSESVLLLDAPRDPPEKKGWSLLKRFVVIFCSSIVIFLRCARPHDRTYGFLSGSLPLAPFGGPHHRRPASWLEGRTAMDTVPIFDWLPANHSLDGFADWSRFHVDKFNRTIPKDHPSGHYSPAKDPLHIPNLQNDVLEPLRDVLHNGSVKIKHIILIKLESTRQDVFPFRTDSYIMEHIKNSYPDGHIPGKVEGRLSNLTRTAEKLTGFETGFNKDKDHPKPYGGISASKAYTAGTYTLKSIAGTVCGVNPLAINYNLEYQHNIYQPCLPHIFEALNKQPNTSNKTDDWTSWPWHTMWMQSMFGTYDHQELLTPALGYKDIMTQESINAAGAKYMPNETEEMKHHGYPDRTLKKYVRDAVVDAEKNKTRLFLGHLTGNTHHPWLKPGSYEELMGNSWYGLNQELNRYLNTVAYQDGWLADILEVLKDAGVADETLLVMAGDHGVSLPDNHGITPYHNPHVGNFHVPLLFSHPKLPQVEIDSAVLSTQILPTILDLLIESSSLNEDSTKIAKDLLPMYEGQSMLRPLIPKQHRKEEWHFTVMNPGGTWVALRSAAKPYRLVVPLTPDASWRFTDVDKDPFELCPEEAFDIISLTNVVQTRHGPEVAKWLDKASHVAEWWVSENHRRWKYDKKNP